MFGYGVEMKCHAVVQPTRCTDMGKICILICPSILSSYQLSIFLLCNHPSSVQAICLSRLAFVRVHVF